MCLLLRANTLIIDGHRSGDNYFKLENGALILFSFFMISGPKTPPNSRSGRILFAFLMAMGAGFFYFGLYRTNGVFYSLALVALFVPLIGGYRENAISGKLPIRFPLR